MTSISDFPAFVLDQIIGTRDTSYVALKLWLSGDCKLRNKLAIGLTFIDLKCHPFGDCRVPKVISHLRSLRHISLYSPHSLVETTSEWPEIIRSWPSSLESLSIHSKDEWQQCLWQANSTHYTRGSSHAIEFETLFPRLQTLALATKGYSLACPAFIDSSLCAALPSSLTELKVPINFTPPYEPLSSLPPNIRHLRGQISWSFGNMNEDDALDELRKCFANAPSSLESLSDPATSTGSVWAKNIELVTQSEHCWFPKSLLELKWARPCPPFSPSIARTMPPNLHTLQLGDINIESYRSNPSNWISDLPRSLTNLSIRISDASVDLTSHVSCLPPSLVDLELLSIMSTESLPFGDWRSVSFASVGHT